MTVNQIVEGIITAILLKLVTDLTNRMLFLDVCPNCTGPLSIMESGPTVCPDCGAEWELSKD